MKLSILSTLLLTAVAAAQAPPAGTWRYLRPAGDGWTTECTFTVTRQDKGWSVSSVTERGSLSLKLASTYAADHALQTSRLTLTDKDRQQRVLVESRDGRATVQAGDKKPMTYDVTPGVIVTSAPDWTDIFLLCKRYDHAKAGKQQFPGLWIHPEQPIQQLKFSIERQGHDEIVHDKKTLKLARFVIHLRGQSAYAAWATTEGLLVRLIPLPTKETRQGLVLEGYEKSATHLLSPMK